MNNQSVIPHDFQGVARIFLVIVLDVVAAADLVCLMRCHLISMSGSFSLDKSFFGGSIITSRQSFEL
jgi:hypothetical protein